MLGILAVGIVFVLGTCVLLYILLGPRKHDSVETMPHFDWLTGNLSFFTQNVDRLHDAMLDIVTKETKDKGKTKILAQIFPQIGHAPTNIYLFDPNVIKYVFETKFDSFGKSNIVHDFVEEIFGDGIFSVDPPKWKFHRKVASRMFSLRNLKNYMFDCALRNCDNLILKMKQLAFADINIINNDMDINETKPIDVFDLFGRLTLDCFIESAFGESLDSVGKAPQRHEFGEAFDKITELCDLRFLDPFWKLKRYFKIGETEGKLIPYCVKIIDTTIYDIISSRKDQNLTDETGKQKHDLLSLFMTNFKNKNSKKDSKDGKDEKMTDKAIRDITLNFVTAARDTTRILLSWFLYVINLPQNDAARRKVIQEILDHCDDALKYENVIPAGLTKDEANRLGANSNSNSANNKAYRYEYLEACLLETLRLYPPVPWLQRYALRDEVIPVTYIDDKNGEEYVKKYKIRKGEGVSIHTYVYSRMKGIWGENASQFDPKRFYHVNKDNVEYYSGIHRYSNYKYPIFNVQPRICLGRHLALMQAKTVIIKLFRQFDIKLFDLTKQNVTYNISFVFLMKEGLKIQILPRNKLHKQQMA